jgi:hypothetical protein
MEPAPPKKGLRADGSILTKERWLDAHPGLLESQIDDARKGNGFWFVPGAADPSQAAIRETERLLEYCFAHGIAVAGYFSPFHPDLYEAVKINRSLNYFWKIPEALKPVFEKHHASLADLQDPAVPGCAGDEFLDTQHESDVCSTRVMLALGAHDNRLRQVFRPEMLSKFLEQRKSSWQLGF